MDAGGTETLRQVGYRKLLGFPDYNLYRIAIFMEHRQLSKGNRNVTKSDNMSQIRDRY